MAQTSSIKDRIYQKLELRFKPQSLEVIDESEKHLGHAGHDGQGESHFEVRITSESFMGKSRVERHRMIYETLNAELAEKVHALAIKASSPNENKNF